MDTIVDVLATAQSIISRVAGFGVNDSNSAASFSLLIAMSFFAAAYISHLSERHAPFHLVLNFVAMFAGGVAGNALLREFHLPLGHELLVTATLTLAGMTGMAFALLYTYRRTDI